MVGEVRPKGIRLRLSCATEAEFIDAFLEYIDDNSVFAPSERFIPRGAPVAFSIELVDGTPMLRGLGTVLDCWSSADNRYERPGVHVEFSQLTETSEVMLDRLLAARERAHARTVPRGGRRRGAPLTQQQWGADVAPATMEMNAQSGDDIEQTDVGPRPQRAITRQRISVPPPVNDAAPVAIDEKSSQTTRYEGPLRAPAIPPPRGSAPALPPPPIVAAKPPPIPRPTPPPPREEPAVMTGEQAPLLVTAAETSTPTQTSAPWWKHYRVGGVFAAGILIGVLTTVASRRPDAPAPRTTAALAQPQLAPAPKIAECPPPPPPVVLATTTPPEPEVKKQLKPAKKAVKPAVVAKPPKPPAVAAAPKRLPAKKPAVRKRNACSSLDCI